MEPKRGITMSYSYLKNNSTLPFERPNKGFVELFCATVYKNMDIPYNFNLKVFFNL